MMYVISCVAVVALLLVGVVIGFIVGERLIKQ